MGRTILNTILCAALATGLGAAAQAQAARPHAGPALKGKVLKSLNLTPEQRQKIRELNGNFKTEAQPLKDRLAANREAMAAASQAKGTAKVRELAVERGNLRGQIAGLRQNTAGKVRETLTPEQQVKADDLIEKARTARRPKK